MKRKGSSSLQEACWKFWAYVLQPVISPGFKSHTNWRINGLRDIDNSKITLWLVEWMWSCPNYMIAVRNVPTLVDISGWDCSPPRKLVLYKKPAGNFEPTYWERIKWKWPAWPYYYALQSNEHAYTEHTNELVRQKNNGIVNMLYIHILQPVISLGFKSHTNWRINGLWDIDNSKITLWLVEWMWSCPSYMIAVRNIPTVLDISGWDCSPPRKLLSFPM